MLGEDEQLAPAVAQFLELGPLQARFQGGELRVGRVVAHPPCLGQEILQRRDFRLQLVQPHAKP